jgi:hypothetical protein
MKFAIAGLIVLLLQGCSGGYEKAENAQDAGREFIRASLEGDYKKARFYMLRDTTNLLLIEQQQRNYQQLSSSEKEQRRQSTIRPLSITNANDSTVVYRYYNTYNPGDTTSMTVVNTHDNWVVDLKTILKH